MNARIALVLVSALLLTTSWACADWVKHWKPSELFERAELVIVGRTTVVAPTGGRGTIRLNARHASPSLVFRAKVRVVEVIKGELPREEGAEPKTKEITITFSRLDPAKLGHVDPTCVHRINLRKDGLYLLYLNASKDGTYVSVLEGERDDAQAVKLLRLETAEQADGANP